MNNKICKRKKTTNCLVIKGQRCKCMCAAIRVQPSRTVCHPRAPIRTTFSGMLQPEQTTSTCFSYWPYMRRCLVHSDHCKASWAAVHVVSPMRSPTSGCSRRCMAAMQGLHLHPEGVPHITGRSRRSATSTNGRRTTAAVQIQGTGSSAARQSVG